MLLALSRAAVRGGEVEAQVNQALRFDCVGERHSAQRERSSQ
jgi:hypothetical protein